MQKHPTLVQPHHLLDFLKASRGAASNNHLRLARLAFAEIEKGRDLELTNEAISILVDVLVVNGELEEAAPFARLNIPQRTSGAEDQEVDTTILERVLDGCAEQGNDSLALSLLTRYENSGKVLKASIIEKFIKLYANKGDSVKVKKWLDRAKEGAIAPTTESYADALRLATETGDTGWCNELITDLRARTKSADAWILILQSSVGIGKSVEEVSELLEEVQKDTGLSQIDLVNEIIEYCIAYGNFYLAERYFNIATAKWGLTPNQRSLALQIQYRLLANDISGAMASYEEAKLNHIIDIDIFRPSVLLLLQALCTGSDKTKMLNSLLEDVIDFHYKLDLSSIAALTVNFVSRDLFDDAIDLLQKYGPNMTTTDRSLLIVQLGNLCGQPTATIQLAWKTYQLLSQIFPELSLEHRTDFMRLFFARGHPDMACKVFSDMASTPGVLPKESTYIECFNGIAKCRDRRQLLAIHNRLKLDSRVEMTRSLLLSLMRAYLACDEPSHTIELYAEVARTPDGPNEEAIDLALEATARVDPKTARQEVQLIWLSMKRWKMMATYGNNLRFVYSLVKAKAPAQAVSFVKLSQKQKNGGVPLSKEIIALVYRGLKDDQIGWQEFEDWAMEYQLPAYREWVANRDQLEATLEETLNPQWRIPIDIDSDGLSEWKTY